MKHQRDDRPWIVELTDSLCSDRVRAKSASEAASNYLGCKIIPEWQSGESSHCGPWTYLATDGTNRAVNVWETR